MNYNNKISTYFDGTDQKENTYISDIDKKIIAGRELYDLTKEEIQLLTDPALRSAANLKKIKAESLIVSPLYKLASTVGGFNYVDPNTKELTDPSLIPISSKTTQLIQFLRKNHYTSEQIKQVLNQSNPTEFEGTVVAESNPDMDIVSKK